MMVFMEGGKRENTRKTLDARREPTSNSTQMCHRTEIELGAPILLPKGLECMFRTLATNFSNTPKSVDRAAVNRRRKHCPVIVDIFKQRGNKLF